MCVCVIYIYIYIHIHTTSKQKIIWETRRISAAYAALGTAMPSSAGCSCPGRRPKVHRSKPPCVPVRINHKKEHIQTIHKNKPKEYPQQQESSGRRSQTIIPYKRGGFCLWPSNAIHFCAVLPPASHYCVVQLRSTTAYYYCILLLRTTTAYYYCVL